MRITVAQQTFIDSLICERMSANTQNKTLANTFDNQRNPVLVKMLHEAWDIDRANESAYYMVKSLDGTLLAYFSLKCGLLYDTINEEYYKQIKKLYDLLLNPEADTEEQQQILDFVYSKYGNTDIKTLLKKKAEKANDLLLTMREDIAREGENPLHRVSRTYPCIEIENFCINETARDKWKSYGMPRNIGETVFWNKILPLVERIEKIVGCTHIFLFAADSTADERLIRYYRQRLGFSTTTSLGANKPIYDLLCQLMYQTIENAKEMRDDFFASFND